MRSHSIFYLAFILNFYYLFIHFLVELGLVAAHGLSLVVASRGGATLRCGVWASHCGGFSCCGARALGARASVVVVRGL